MLLHGTPFSYQCTVPHRLATLSMRHFKRVLWCCIQVFSCPKMVRYCVFAKFQQKRDVVTGKNSTFNCEHCSVRTEQGNMGNDLSMWSRANLGYKWHGYNSNFGDTKLVAPVWSKLNHGEKMTPPWAEYVRPHSGARAHMHACICVCKQKKPRWHCCRVVAVHLLGCSNGSSVHGHVKLW